MMSHTTMPAPLPETTRPHDRLTLGRRLGSELVNPRRLAIAGAAVLFVWLALQITAPARTNAPVERALRLESHAAVPPEVLTTLRRACYDCHSDETRWPWYSRVAPTSWLVVHDVNEGRGHMNFSRWGEYNPYDRADMLDDACKLVTKGEMPLRPYVLMHGDAKLTAGDKDALCAWTRSEATRLTSAGAGQER